MRSPEPEQPTVNLLGIADVSVSEAGIDLQQLITEGLAFRDFVSDFFSVNGMCYVSTRATVINRTGDTLNNFSLYASNAPESVGGTAIRNLRDNSGALSDPAAYQAIIPTHQQQLADGSVVINPEGADLQGYTAAEVSQVQGFLNDAFTGYTALNYGFVARSSSSGRAIANGEQGTVTLAVRYPCDGSPLSFEMTLALIDVPVPRVTRGENESLEDLLNRINELFDGNPPEDLEVAGFNGADLPNIGTELNLGDLQTSTEDVPAFSQRQRLAPTPTVGDAFGERLTTFGNLLAVSSFREDDGLGRVYMYQTNGNTYTSRETLRPTEIEITDFFGRSLALTNTTLAVGAVFDDDVARNAGAVYVFEDNAGTFQQTAKLTASNGAEVDRFGEAVALSGNLLLVSALSSDNNRGSVYLFQNINGDWQELDQFTPADATSGDLFGRVIVMAGSTALVATTNANGNAGAVYVLDVSPAGITQIGKLTAPTPTADARYGTSLAISGDIAIIADSTTSYLVDLTSLTQTSEAFNQVSAVALETNTAAVGTTDTQTVTVFDTGEPTNQELVTGTNVPESARFGSTVALADGALLVAALDDGGGAVYVFRR
ncbi:MAG: FG-GAP repeat protein [Deinococcota bacterium]